MKPPKLSPGDLVAIISPSNTIYDRENEVRKACSEFEKLTGLKTVLAPNALAQHYYSAGTVRQRLDDFHWALKHPDVKGIVFSVGGDTAVELVESLDYEFIKSHPKIIAGISDATTLLNAITAKTGLITFLGIEFLDFARQPMPYEAAAIKQAWFDGTIGEVKPNSNWRDLNDTPTTYTGWQCIRPGNASGKLVGGNYSSFAQLYHTPYCPSVEGSILAIEFYRQPKKAIQRCLAQLKLWGTYEKISGLIVGYCVGSDNPDILGNNRDLKELVLEATENFDFPIMQVGEIGHQVENILLPLGAKAMFDSKLLRLHISEHVVS